MVYSIDAVRNGSMFAIDSATGELTLATPAGGAAGQKYYVDVRATKDDEQVVQAIEVTVSTTGETGVLVIVR